MNKRKIDEMIPHAYVVLKDVEISNDKDPKRIVNNGQIDNKWRGQIASFGSAIATGSLLSAVAFFSAENGAEVPRQLLMQSIWLVLNKDKIWPLKENGEAKEVGEVLFDFLKSYRGEEQRAKEDIINATIALKLAMNFYDLGKGDKKDAESELSSK